LYSVIGYFSGLWWRERGRRVAHLGVVPSFDFAIGTIGVPEDRRIGP
jgi:hypothetical protein